MAVEVADIVMDTGDHVVQFYEHESELAQIVGAYLGGTALTEGVAIVIATEAHRRAFETELQAAGIDFEQACRQGTLVLRDAATMLAAFMSEGEIDTAAFREVIGSVVRQAAEIGRPVRAYGEMVALLWDAGDVLAAIKLEELWNELLRELQFSLLCAYQSNSVTGPEHAESLQQICHLHSSVLHPARSEEPGAADLTVGEVSADFSAERSAPGSARHFVAEVLARWGHRGIMLEDAQLVVTELATNAVLHARSPFSVTVRAEDSRVRVSVTDASALAPTPRDDGPMAVSGRGLRLVAALCTDWGFDVNGAGKTVWAELRS